MLFVGHTTYVLCEDISMVFLGLHKYDLDESIFHKFMDKMVSDVHMLCSLVGSDILGHEYGPDIVYSDYDWELHWNSH